MKKDMITKKSRKIRAEKKAVRKPRLTKEEREARKLKLQEEHAAKKAVRLAEREAKKRKAAQKPKAKERAEAKKAREAARAEKKAARAKKVRESGIKIIAIDGKPVGKKAKTAKVKKVSVQEKIEAERNEWKALSAIRRYVKSNAKALEELDGNKLERKLKKLGKMGYEVLRGPDGKLLSVGYSFEVGVRIKVAKPAPKKKEERKPRKPRAEKATEEVQQPQDSAEVVVPEELPVEAEEKLLTDDEILEAAKKDNEAQPVEVLAGDTFKDETEIAEDDSLKNSDNDDEELDEDDDGGDDKDDDILGRDGDISDEQADYRREAFREMEGNGTWD